MMCKTNDTLERALRSTSCENVRCHIEKAIASKSGVNDAKPILPRYLTDLVGLGEAPYCASGTLSFLVDNSHSGQRKLCIAMIEFLTTVKAHQLSTGTVRPLLVVYAGSSILASAAGRDCFPGTKFVCLDPAWRMTVPVVHREGGAHGSRIMNECVHTFRHVSVNDMWKALRERDIVYITDKAGRMTDFTCQALKALARTMPGYEMVFVSDVRTTQRQSPDQKEATIADDMLKQARWLQTLGSRYYSLKLRLPFTLTPVVSDKYTAVAAMFGATPAVCTEERVPYVSGTCVLQKYGRNMSTEMRLIGTDAPSLASYNIRQVERVFYPFNLVHRCHTDFAIPAPTCADERAHIDDHHILAYAAHKSRCTYDHLGEAVVLRDACLVSNRLETHPKDDAETVWNLFTRRLALLFAGRSLKP